MGSTRTSILEILRNANSSVSVLRSSRAALPWTGEMDAATLLCSPPCRSSAQASPGFWITLFWVRARSSRRSRHSLAAVTLNVDQLVLKRASASRLSGEWNDDDYDGLADGIVVGRIMKAAAATPLASVEA